MPNIFKSLFSIFSLTSLNPRLLIRFLCSTILSLGFYNQAIAGTYKADALIHFNGTSTLHDFEGSVVVPSFEVILEGGDDQSKFISSKVKIDTLSITTDHTSRDKKMWQMLDSQRFPFIEGEIVKMKIPLTKEPSEIKIYLRICNVGQPIVGTISNWLDSKSGFSCLLKLEISLESFELKPPSIFGLITVGDTVSVECEIKGTLL
jgi:hypothetical protein